MMGTATTSSSSIMSSGRSPRRWVPATVARRQPNSQAVTARARSPKQGMNTNTLRARDSGGAGAIGSGHAAAAHRTLPAPRKKSKNSG